MYSVLTLNINGQRDAWLSRRELLLAKILRELPDFIAFQDVSVMGRQVNWLTRQLNARWGSRLYYWTQIGAGGLFRSMASGGVAILSRLPILWEERVDLGSGMDALLVNIELPLGRTLDLVSIQLASGRRLPEARYEQGMALMRVLSTHGRSATQIIAGDFNAVPDSRIIRRFKQTYRSAFESVHQVEPVATFPTALVMIEPHWSGCLDYIFVSTAVTVSGIEFFGRRPHPEDARLFVSSHVGLLARVEFPEVVG